MKYLNRILKVKNSLLRFENFFLKGLKELDEDVWIFKMLKCCYKPDPRNYYEGYRSVKDQQNQKINLC